MLKIFSKQKEREKNFDINYFSIADCPTEFDRA